MMELTEKQPETLFDLDSAENIQRKIDELKEKARALKSLDIQIEAITHPRATLVELRYCVALPDEGDAVYSLKSAQGGIDHFRDQIVSFMRNSRDRLFAEINALAAELGVDK